VKELTGTQSWPTLRQYSHFREEDFISQKKTVPGSRSRRRTQRWHHKRVLGEESLREMRAAKHIISMLMVKEQQDQSTYMLYV
jgi:hypothetical protein